MKTKPALLPKASPPRIVDVLVFVTDKFVIVVLPNKAVDVDIICPTEKLYAYKLLDVAFVESKFVTVLLVLIKFVVVEFVVTKFAINALVVVALVVVEFVTFKPAMVAKVEVNVSAVPFVAWNKSVKKEVDVAACKLVFPEAIRSVNVVDPVTPNVPENEPIVPAIDVPEIFPLLILGFVR